MSYTLRLMDEIDGVCSECPRMARILIVGADRRVPLCSAHAYSVSWFGSRMPEWVTEVHKIATYDRKRSQKVRQEITP